MNERILAVLAIGGCVLLGVACVVLLCRIQKLQKDLGAAKEQATRWMGLSTFNIAHSVYMDEVLTWVLIADGEEPGLLTADHYEAVNCAEQQVKIEIALLLSYDRILGVDIKENTRENIRAVLRTIDGPVRNHQFIADSLDRIWAATE